MNLAEPQVSTNDLPAPVKKLVELINKELSNFSPRNKKINHNKRVYLTAVPLRPLALLHSGK